MITNCEHCGTRYELPDKMLGKKGRCKSCGKLFLLAPTEEEIELADVELPQPTGSTARIQPVSHYEESDDPLDALASAADDSNAMDQPIRLAAPSAPARGPSRPSSRSRGYDDEDDDYRTPKRMARGAQLSMVLGITACGLVAGGGVCGIIAMVNGDDQSLLVTLGIIALGLTAIGAIIAMTALVNSTSAVSRIRHARHPLGGRSEASTGTITGGIALGLVFVIAISGGIWLSQRGGITFTKEVDAEGTEVTKPD